MDDIKSEKITKDVEIEKLKNIFYNINKRLKDLKKTKTARMEQEDDTFYWVPESVFHIED